MTWIGYRAERNDLRSRFLLFHSPSFLFRREEKKVNTHSFLLDLNRGVTICLRSTNFIEKVVFFNPRSIWFFFNYFSKMKKNSYTWNIFRLPPKKFCWLKTFLYTPKNSNKITVRMHLELSFEYLQTKSDLLIFY